MLSSRYPYKIYGKEVKEGFEVPSFFTEIIDKGSGAETRNYAKGGFTVKIVYFQDGKSEADQLEKVDEIKALFGMVFRVGDRRLTVGEYTHDFIGEYSDILQINVDFNYLENTLRNEAAELAEVLEARITQG